MIKFNKAFNAKIVALTISVSFLFTGALYPSPISKDTLRVPVGQESTYERLTLTRRELFRKAKPIGEGLIVASLAAGGLKLYDEFEKERIEEQCLEDKKMLEQKLEDINKNHGLERGYYYQLDRILQIDGIFEVIKDYLDNNTDNEYRLLVALDVLGFFFRDADYRNMTYELLYDENIGRTALFYSKGKYSKLGECLLMEFISSELIRDEDKCQYLWLASAEGYSNSQSYISAVKGLIYGGNRILEEVAIEHLGKTADTDAGEFALNVLKEITMDTSDEAIDDYVVRKIVEKLWHIHRLRYGSIAVSTPPHLSFTSNALRFGELNLAALQTDSVFMTIKALREMKRLSLNDNKWAKTLYDFIFERSGDKEVVIVSDIDNEYDFDIDWKEELLGTAHKITKYSELKPKIKRKIGRDIEGQGYLITLRLKNILAEPEKTEIEKISKDIIADYILCILSHETDHVRTHELDRAREIDSTGIQKFIDEKHAYLVAADITKEIYDSHNSIFTVKFWKSMSNIFNGTLIAFSYPYINRNASVKYRGLVSRLDEFIIDRHGLDQEEILEAIPEINKGGDIFSGEDLEFQFNDWVYEPEPIDLDSLKKSSLILSGSI